jgi:hypothetical protein
MPVSTPLEKAIWRQSCYSELPQLVQNCSKIDFVLSADVIPQLVSDLCPILIVNGMSLDNDALDALEFVLRADYVCWCLCLTNHKLLPTGMSIVSALCLSVIRMMGRMHAQALRSFLCTRGRIGEIVCGMMVSATRLLVMGDLPDSTESQQLISSTGHLVQRLLAVRLPRH